MKRRDFLGTVLVGGAGFAALGTGRILAADKVAGKSAGNAAEPCCAGAGAGVGAGAGAGGCGGDPKIRERRKIDFDWRFHLGDLKDAQAVSYDDAKWRLLDLPHDWSIEGKIEEKNPASWHGAYLPGGIGWYRKKIAWDDSWKGRNVFIDFDGVYMNSDVWINGHHLGRWPYGYSTFRYDLTPHLKPGENIIAVRVDNAKQPSGRWYTGCGIYRHVWLNVVNPVHVDHWGTFVTTPEVTKNSARVNIKTRLANSGNGSADVTVEQIIRDKSGRIVARVKNPATVESNAKTEISQDMTFAYPALWSPETPNLYRVETVVRQGGQAGNSEGKSEKILDLYSTPLGVRTLDFSPKWGFRLNGVRTMLKGVSNHHDAGGAVGTALPDDVLYHRLVQLKEIGCNAVRTAHHPLAPEFVAYCDELGLMVLNEAFDGWHKPKGNSRFDYGNFFKEWWERDLGGFIRRDRNSPSVIMWSIGNEVGGFTNDWQIKIANFTRALDPTRPVNQARGSEGTALDVYGFNSEAEKIGKFESYHKEFPDRVLLATENPHSRQTRGVYFSISRRPDTGAKGEWHPAPSLTETEVFTEKRNGYSSSFDNHYFSIGVRDNYRLQCRKYPFLIGSFRWVGFDYLGEANDKWPFRSKDKGVFDLAGLAKDHYYLYQSIWTTAPMVHLLPHWTHPGKEGVALPVVAYTNCHSVELFLDDKSLGEKVMPPELQIVWLVPYKAGVLRAVAKNEHGVPMAETVRKTAGAPAAVDLALTKSFFRPNRHDASIVEVTIVDKDGNMIPDAEDKVVFEIEGPGKLIGVENGDVLDLNATKHVNTRNVFKGKCVGIVQATDKAGEIKITVRSGNLKAGTARIICGEG